jgi:hypothetical protein
MTLAGCVPEVVKRPTLGEARLGRGQLAADTGPQPGEIRAEIVQIDPARNEIRVRTDDHRERVLTYDFNRTRVFYHGREYAVNDLEAGDLILFEPRPRGGSYVDVIRLREPVQARAGSTIGRRPLPPPRPQVVEGRVEKIDHDLGVFDLVPLRGGVVTVTIPYNARGADIDSFRRLRSGDYVRLQGEFVNRDNFQLLAFLSDRSQSRR